VVDLRTEQRVDAGAARKDDERETDDCAHNKAKLHYLTEQCRPEIHQDIADNLMIIERNVAEETYLEHTYRLMYLVFYKETRKCMA